MSFVFVHLFNCLLFVAILMSTLIYLSDHQLGDLLIA